MSLMERAIDRALNNNHQYHLGAIRYRGKGVERVATNTEKTHPKYTRVYDDPPYFCHSLHAEMNALIGAQPGDILYVFRVLENRELTMARPCEHCQQAIRDARIARVYYTNWEGQWTALKM